MQIKTSLTNKVNKESGKGLSTNNYTSSDKTAVGTISSKANSASPTFTGSVTLIDGAVISNTDATFNAAAGKNCFINSANNSTILLQPDGNSIIGGFAVTCNAGSVRPLADNFANLGEAALRWKNLFVATGTINTSDEHNKKDISELNQIKAFFMALNPVQFRFKDGTSGRMHHGLIAQEVETAMSESGLTDMDFAGLIKASDEENEGEYIYGLRYTEFIPMLIKMVQDQQKIIEDLTMRVAKLE